jgi:hypothetical protein
MQRLLLTSAALVFATAQGALGFNDCGNEAFAGAGTSSQVYAKAPFDTLRALVVLASFPEEYSVQEDQCSADSTGWPDRLTIPAWAYDMIEDTNNPTVPGSITHFFYEMSDRDNNSSSSSPKHVIKGTVYPDVVELPERINTYVGLGSLPNEGPKYANMDVVRQVIPSLGDDAVNYDIEGRTTFSTSCSSSIGSVGIQTGQCSSLWDPHSQTPGCQRIRRLLHRRQEKSRSDQTRVPPSFHFLRGPAVLASMIVGTSATPCGTSIVII